MSYSISADVISTLQAAYRNKHNLQGSGTLSTEQVGLAAITEYIDGKLYTYDGNLAAFYEDVNGDKKVNTGELRYATDSGTLGERAYADYLEIKGEGEKSDDEDDDDEIKFVLDLINGNVVADNSHGEIRGCNINLYADNGSEIEMSVGGRNNTAIASGEGTEVTMRDHDPDSPWFRGKTTLTGAAVKGGSVIQAAYHEDTINNGFATSGGTLKQQGVRNYGIAEGPGAFVGQQGSRYQNNMESVAYVQGGATALQEGDNPYSKLVAYTDDANVYQKNLHGGFNYAETLGYHDNSLISQKGYYNMAAGYDVGGVKQVNSGGGFNQVSDGMLDNWLTLGHRGDPYYYGSYVDYSGMRMHPYSTGFFDNFSLKPIIDFTTLLEQIARYYQ